MFENLGKALRFARETKGKSQAELAEKAKVGKSQISKYETGKELPKLDSLQRICQELELEPYQLFYGMHLLDRHAAHIEHGGDIFNPEPPKVGILTPGVEDAFQALTKCVFNLYNQLAGDRVRSFGDIWKVK